MLKIRLARVGKKNKPQFKVVLQEHTVAPGGRHVEVLGSYDPHTKKTTLKKERIEYWIGQGAQTSDTVHNLLVSQEVVKGPKIAVKMPKKAVDEKPSDTEKAPGEASEKIEKSEEKQEETKTEETKHEPAKEETKSE
jgi:small subunit ribosomal protein S16